MASQSRDRQGASSHIHAIRRQAIPNPLRQTNDLFWERAFAPLRSRL